MTVIYGKFFYGSIVFEKWRGMFKVHEIHLGKGSVPKNQYQNVHKHVAARLYFKFKWNKMAVVAVIPSIFKKYSVGVFLLHIALLQGNIFNSFVKFIF